MHPLSDHIACPGTVIEGHELVWIPFLGFPERKNVLVPELAGVAEAFQMILVDLRKSFPGILRHVDPLGVPISVLAERLGTPVKPHADLSLVPPYRGLEMIAE